MSSRRLVLILAALGIVGAGLVGWWFSSHGDPVELLSSDNVAEQRQGVAALSEQADTASGLERIARTVRNENPSVACLGLQALAASAGPDKQLPPEAVEIAESATRDPREVVKLAAIQTLEATTPELPEDPTVPNIVLKAFVTSKSPQTRSAAANALAKFQHWDAMGPLLDALEDESPAVRGSANMAIRKILGLDYGFRANDPLGKRQAVIARLRRDWKAQRPYHELYAKRVRDKRMLQQ